jgi:NAD(P)-dependent dehydrogenase (short-subunit alcohol dehydrogenase family)
MNISEGAAVQKMVEQTVEKFGRLDFACNNAGTEGIPGSLADTDEENYQKIFDTNVKGTWLCMKYEIQQMVKQDSGGKIVNIASFVGLVGFPGVPLYSASKHAIVGMTRTAALEYIQKGVRINAVCPGVVDTPMVDRFTGGNAEAKAGLGATEPIGRLQTPDEVARAVLWLCSEESSFSVASLLVSDGGITAQ